MASSSRLSQNGTPSDICPNCGFLAWCLPAHLELHDLKRLQKLITHQRLIKRGQHLYRVGSELSSMYVVSSGFLQFSVTTPNGAEHVTGFAMNGEPVGFEAIETGRYICSGVALEDSSICGICFADFQELCRALPKLQRHYHQSLSAEIARDKAHMLMLGSMNAQERLATFLLEISARFSTHGNSGTGFRLPMTRKDIASHTGLTLETVSRMFSHFRNTGIISINNRALEIIAPARLQQTAKNHSKNGHTAPL